MKKSVNKKAAATTATVKITTENLIGNLQQAAGAEGQPSPVIIPANAAAAKAAPEKFSVSNVCNVDFSQKYKPLVFDPAVGLPINPEIAATMTPPENYPAVHDAPVYFLATTVGQWLSTAWVIPGYQRSDVYTASFMASLAESAIIHRYIPPVTLIENEDGELKYHLSDGQQRTKALEAARKKVAKENLPLYDSCPFYVVITKAGGQTTEEELFSILNTNNRLSDAQAVKGMFSHDVQAVIDTVYQSGILGHLSTVKRKADVFATERVTRQDDLCAVMALASIQPGKLCTNMAGVADVLKTVSSIDDLPGVLDKVQKTCEIVGHALLAIGSLSETNDKGKTKLIAKGLLSKLSKAAALSVVYAVAYNKQPEVSELLDLICKLYDLDGKAQNLPAITVSDGMTKTSLRWFDITDGGGRGNGKNDVANRVIVATRYLEIIKKERAAAEKKAAEEAANAANMKAETEENAETAPKAENFNATETMPKEF